MEKKCSIDGCEKPVQVKGLCYMHYNRVRQEITDMRPEKLPSRSWKLGDTRWKNKGHICSVIGCDKPFYAKGLCRNHYAIKLRTGQALPKRYLFKLFKLKCSIGGCEELAAGPKGLCIFHRNRTYEGIDLNRPKGIRGPLNHNWKGGIAQYPNHYEMKKMRKIVLEEANYICEYCGKPANQIHHKDLSRDNHSRENLAACCRSCNKKLAKPYTSKFKRLYGKTLKQLAMDMNISIARVSKLHTQNRLLFTTESITCA